MSMVLVKDCGHPRHRIMKWIKEGKVRYLKAGNRYLIDTQWLAEDLKKMAEDNMNSKPETIEYGKLRKIGG